MGRCLCVVLAISVPGWGQPPPTPQDTVREAFAQAHSETSAPAVVGASYEASARSVPAWEIPAGGSQLRVTPYGSVWVNMLYASERIQPGPFTLWVFSEQQQGEPALEIDARRSRLGLDLDGVDVPWGTREFRFRSRFEIDFLGQFLTENRAGARLRHAYAEFADDEWSLLVGQTWDLISPLRPGTLNFSVGWAAGNIGFRRTQFRLQRQIPLATDATLLLQGSLNQDIVDDFPDDPGVRRESVAFPVIMARSALQRESPHGRPLVVGVSGHYGETGFDFVDAGPPPLNLPPQDDARYPTWSVNLDADLPLTDGLALRGEFFYGANLSPFFGGIGQGVCPCLREPIRSRGGWFEVVRVWSDQWESHAGFGIDDPVDGDSLLGRVRNQFVFGNLIWHITGEFSTGLEVTWWRTLYQERRIGQIPPAELTPSAPGEALTLEWMVRYDF